MAESPYDEDIEPGWQMVNRSEVRAQSATTPPTAVGDLYDTASKVVANAEFFDSAYQVGLGLQQLSHPKTVKEGFKNISMGTAKIVNIQKDSRAPCFEHVRRWWGTSKKQVDLFKKIKASVWIRLQ